MPQFAVHFCQFRPDCKLFVLPSFEAYGELSDTLHEARLSARKQGYDALRVWLCAVDYDRLKKRQAQWLENVGVELVIYQKNDTAKPGNAMMVIRKYP